MKAREIKFRAWDEDWKKMVYPIGIDWQGQHSKDGIAVYYWVLNEDGSKRGIPGHKTLIHLMQFTGLKDNNGKEIYEGDIMTFNKGYCDDSWTDQEQGMPYTIYWKDDEARFVAFRGLNILTPGSGQLGTFKWTWEVIGNIHENPELL